MSIRYTRSHVSGQPLDAFDLRAFVDWLDRNNVPANAQIRATTNEVIDGESVVYELIALIPSDDEMQIR